MSRRRIIRLSWVTVWNILYCRFGIQAFFPPTDWAWISIAIVLCHLCVLGEILEITKHRFAILANTAPSAFLALIFVTAGLWMPYLPGDRAEAVGYLTVLSVVPFFVALVTFVFYKVFEVEDSNPPSFSDSDQMAR